MKTLSQLLMMMMAERARPFCMPIDRLGSHHFIHDDSTNQSWKHLVTHLQPLTETTMLAQFSNH